MQTTVLLVRFNVQKPISIQGRQSPCEDIRAMEKAMGDGVKKPSPSENKNILIARKSIVAKKPIKKRERFSEDNLMVKRPGTGISPMEWDDILGKSSNNSYKVDDLIQK